MAILSMNSDRYAEYLLAVPWAGAAVNPVNIRWTPAEIAYSMTDSDTHVLLIDEYFIANCAQVGEGLLELDQLDPERLQQRVGLAHSCSSCCSR